MKYIRFDNSISVMNSEVNNNNNEEVIKLV